MTSADQPASATQNARPRRDIGRIVALVLVAVWTLAAAALGITVLLHAGDEQREMVQSVASGSAGSVISRIQIDQQLVLLLLTYIGVAALWAGVFAGRGTRRRTSAATSAVMVVGFFCLYLNHVPGNDQWWRPGPTDQQSGPFEGLHFLTWDQQASAALILLAAAAGVVLFVLGWRRGPRLVPQAVAGWYPHDGIVRYWDGTSWTSHVVTPYTGEPGGS
jgi:Protein of unknown function (DUF2510)